MAYTFNSVQLIGFLGADPELRYTPNGKEVCHLSVATNQVYNNSQGERVTETEWHKVVLWGNDAVNASKYLTKGRQVHVEGRIKTDIVGEGDDRKYYTKIIARPGTLGYLGGNGAPQAAVEVAQVSEADIPF